jgi:arsenate reductase (thioredoxin)
MLQLESTIQTEERAPVRRDRPRRNFSRPYRLLFVCTGNACRSAMAEGFARHYGNGQIEVFSAGVAPGTLDPRAVRVMAEKDISIVHHVPRSVKAFAIEDMDLVVTLCDYAQQYCPSGHAAQHRLHWSVKDPSRRWVPDWLVLGTYRQVRDDLGGRIRDLLMAVQALATR